MSMDPFDLNSFWQYLSEILRQLDRHRSTDNIGLAEQLLIRAEDCQSVLRAVLGRVTPIAAGNQLVQDIELLLSVLGDHCNHISEWTLRQDSEHPRLAGGMCPVTQPCYARQGRPQYDIKEDLESLLELGFNFRQIAEIFGVSERTIRWRRMFFGLPVGNNYSTISDDDLDFTISNILQVRCSIVHTWCDDTHYQWFSLTG